MRAQDVAASIAARALNVSEISGGSVRYIGKWLVSLNNGEWCDEYHSIIVGIFDTKSDARQYMMSIRAMLTSILSGALSHVDGGVR